MSRAFLALAMATVGFFVGETGASLSLIVTSLGLSSSAEGLVVAVRFFGGIFCGLFLWLRADTIALGRGIVFSLIAAVVTAPLVFMGTYGAALTVGAVRGFVAGFIIPASAVFAARQSRWGSAEVAGTANAALSAGLVMIGVSSILLAGRPIASWQLYWSIGPAFGALALVVGLAGGNRAMARETKSPGTKPPGTNSLWTKSPWTKSPERRTENLAAGFGQSIRQEMARLSSGTAWVFAVASFLVVGTESVLIGLMPRMSDVAASAAAGTEAFALAIMLGILAGRVLGTFLLRWFSSARVLAASTVCLLLAGAFWGIATGWSLLVAMFALGASTANVFPALIGVISDAMGRRAPTTIAAMGWTGATGGTLIPMAIAVMAASMDQRAIVALVALAPLTIATVLSLTRRPRERGL